MYQIKLSDEVVEYSYKVEGSGDIDRVHFFETRTGKRHIGSIAGFDVVFCSCPNMFEKNYFHPTDFVTISAGNDTFAGGQALSCSPFFYGVQMKGDKRWLGIGLAVKPGDYIFQSFDYNYERDGINAGPGGFSLPYYGKVRVRNEWKSPSIVFITGKSEYDALNNYVTWLKDNEYLPLIGKQKNYDWWGDPIFCGWREQIAHVYRKRGCISGESSKSYFGACTQRLYRHWVNILLKNRVRPGVIIIDAKWQTKLADPRVDQKKWPHMREFIDKCHNDNQHVLLWIGAWSRDGAPRDECILKGGKPIAVDPTNRKYEKRLRRRIREMISCEKGCLNADGFKIDSTLSLPGGYGLKNHGNLWGLELQRYYMNIFHSEAKKYKKDALIGLFIANPYLWDLADVVRVGDMYTYKESPVDSMIHRYNIIRIGMPGKLVDTDGQHHFDLSDGWQTVIDRQAEIGIPCLYNAQFIIHYHACRPVFMNKFNLMDYKHIAGVMDKYRNLRTRSRSSDLTIR